MSTKIGFLFPGQGSQYLGMGKDLFQTFPAAREIFQKADALLGYSIRQICLEGPEEKLTQTIYAQPSIFVASIACLRVLQEKLPHLKPSFSAGLSLGEFTALVAVNALSFEQGLKLVQRRAEAMETAAQKNRGTMASIMGLGQTDCEILAKETGCELANLNSPDQFVLSGTLESIEKACRLAESKGAKRAIPLKVSGAFHSRLMREAKEDLGKALRETEIKKPDCLFVPNAVGHPVEDPEQIRRLLAEQLMSPVHWIRTMEAAKNARIQSFIEIGPGKVLKGLFRRFDKNLSVENCGTSEDLQNLQPLHQNT